MDDGILDPTGGSVLLYGAGETLVDSLIWGAGQGGSVSLAVGDFASESVEPGTTIGRPPGAVQPLRSTDWVVYPEAEVSPGEPNPASYRVQVATDETFSDVVLEETWNFDSKDDVCGDLSGTITWTLHETRDGPRDEHETSHDVVTLSVRFDEVDGEWVDSGSSYVWNGSSQFDTNPGDDPKAGYCNELHKTTTTTGGGAFETSLASSIWVDVAAESDEVYVSSWVAGVLNGHKETGTLMSDGGPNRWCELVPSDYTQGGGSTLDSQAEWGQIPRCPNYSESVMGTIGKDGRTAVFECEETETYEPVEGATGTVTMSVTGQLTFAKGQ